jgi:hypothetical protein
MARRDGDSGSATKCGSAIGLWCVTKGEPARPSVVDAFESLGVPRKESKTLRSALTWAPAGWAPAASAPAPGARAARIGPRGVGGLT